MSRYIAENDVYNLFNARGVAQLHVGDIDVLPRADVVEVVHGRWNQDGIYNVCSVCNNCTLMPHLKGLSKFNYCPNCGAKMDSEDYRWLKEKE